MLLVLAMLTTNMWAQINFLSGDGTEGSPYLIQTANDWNNLADYVAEGNDCAGSFFKMTANIGTVEEPITKPIGKQIGTNKLTDRMRFAGIFDGDHHTLTVNINSNNDEQFHFNKGYCAPFAYAKNVTISNLHVMGNITTTGQFASGLVGQSGPENGSVADKACTITNCHVSATFVGNTTGNNTNGNHGIFIAIAEGTATISDCWFDGALTGSNYYYSGGFIGLNKATAYLSNCLFNPTEITIQNNNIGGSSEFVHNISGTIGGLENCYYTKSFSEPEDAQGTKVFATYAAGSIVEAVSAVDGNTYYIIKHNINWMDIDQALSGTSSNIEITLPLDITAGSEDEALIVSAGKTVTMNMNGFMLDRGLDIVSAQAEGYVIKVEEGGALTISGNGTIKGGNNTGNGGAIYNEGSLIINNGVSISGNYSQYGAGIYMNGGVLTLDGCTIANNSGLKNVNSYGVGVYAANGTLNIQGAVQIKDNKCIKTKAQQNVYLKNGEILNVTGSISGAMVKVSMETPDVFTNGLNGNGNANNFACENSGYSVKVVGNEAKLVKLTSLTVNAYTNSQVSDRWVFIASPVEADVNVREVTGLLTNTYDLYRFNEDADLEWENYRSHTEGFVLENGKGYLYANNKKVTLRFIGDVYEAASKEVDLDYTEGRRFAGVNLVGNPFAGSAYVNRAYYKMNANGDDIELVSDYANNPIAVCMGVIVMAEGANEKVTFSTTAPAKSSSKGNVQMTLTKAGMRDNTVEDKAVVSFNEDMRLGKFIFNEEKAKLYIPQNGKDYAVASIEKQGEMPVSFKASENGSYTISFNTEDVEMGYLHLIDNLTGNDVDLLATPSYTFNAKTDDYASRFRLVFSANGNEDSDNFAFVSNGHIIVNGQGTVQVYDITGRMVSSHNDVNHITTEGMSAGVYVIRLTDGNGTKTQKIVIK